MNWIEYRSKEALQSITLSYAASQILWNWGVYISQLIFTIIKPLQNCLCVCVHACVCVCVRSGWIRYAERILGSLVTPHICTARSSQQIMGCLVKDYFSKQQVSMDCVLFILYGTAVMILCCSVRLNIVRDFESSFLSFLFSLKIEKRSIALRCDAFRACRRTLWMPLI